MRIDSNWGPGCQWSRIAVGLPIELTWTGDKALNDIPDSESMNLNSRRTAVQIHLRTDLRPSEHCQWPLAGQVQRLRRLQRAKFWIRSY
jgi:hypothetical protein